MATPKHLPGDATDSMLEAAAMHHHQHRSRGVGDLVNNSSLPTPVVSAPEIIPELQSSASVFGGWNPSLDHSAATGGGGAEWHDFTGGNGESNGGAT